MKKDIRLYLADILECLEKIEEYLKGISEEKFYRETKIQDAVLRRLEIMGEATKHIPSDFRKKYPDIPWQKIAGLRDVLIHEYFGVDLRRVWNIAKKDLPNLKQEIFKSSKELKS